MEVIALIMAAFAALLVVERKSEDAPPSRSSRYDREAAYYKARKAAREGILARGRFKIAGEYGDYKIREKLSGGCATHGSVHTLRQAKEWLWCLHNNFDYDACKKAHKNGRARRSRKALQEARDIEESNRDLELQAYEMGWRGGSFSTDNDGRRTYYPPEGAGRYTYY
tara:strand:+ start:89 stop:592 length:504 start_codon:yes stop_codon:yes gene_type:complete